MERDEAQAAAAAEQLRAQESELQPASDTSGLAAKLQQVQVDVESQQLAGTIRLARARGQLDAAPEEASAGEPQARASGWEATYREQAVETMAWYYPELDDDLHRALDRLDLRGGRALDLGTGPGSQAMQLARRGFTVTASDISASAIRLAHERAAAQGIEVSWVEDDIVSSRLSGQFDLIFDRGCFHTLPPERRPAYLDTVYGLLSPGGYLFVKCFSHLQPGTWGPNRFTPDELRALFEPRLTVLSIVDTVYQGTLDPLPLALFSTMRRAA